MKLSPIALSLGAGATAVLIAGCGGGGASTGSSGGSGVVDGGTFTLALASDPGNLDPQSSAASSLFTVTQFAYDSLVSVNSKTGAIESDLATKWSAKGKKVTLTLAKGITCSDGSKLTATDVAKNVSYVADPKNKSPFLGTFLPPGATAKADNAARRVTITLQQPAPFVLTGLANLPIVCPKGMADRKSLAESTDGTGPYKLTQAAPNDHYTYTVRKGYKWGPNGATTATPGMPDKVVIKIVQNETTAANLLLSGGLNAAQVLGPDRKRLEKAGLFAAKMPALVGEQWYNHTAGRPTSDPKVRMALTQALDLAQLRKVLTSGTGAPATTLAVMQPNSCPGDSISRALPKTDPGAAAKLLDQAGWAVGKNGTRTKDGKPLTLTLLYPSKLGSGGAAAAELAVKQWKTLGVQVTARGQSETALTQTIFGGGNWDVGWVPLNVNSPDQLVPFLSGPGAPKGTNFAGIKNAAYDAAVQKAMSIPGSKGCSTWLKAESNLVAKADVVPFANSTVLTFGAKAKFKTPGTLVPTSIRMLAK